MSTVSILSPTYTSKTTLLFLVFIYIKSLAVELKWPLFRFLTVPTTYLGSILSEDTQLSIGTLDPFLQLFKGVLLVP